MNEYNFFGGNFIQFLPRNWDCTNLYDSIANKKLDVATHAIITVGSQFYYGVPAKIFRKFSDSDTRKLASLNGAYSLTDGVYVLVQGIWVNKFQGVFDLQLRQLVDDSLFTGMQIFY